MTEDTSLSHRMSMSAVIDSLREHGEAKACKVACPRPDGPECLEDDDGGFDSHGEDSLVDGV